MENDRVYWLGFSAFSGIGPVKFEMLLTYFKTAKAAWMASEIDLLQAGLGEKLIAQFIDFRKTFSVESYGEKLAAKKVSFFILNDPLYPALLKQIQKPPFVLYVKGNKEVLFSHSGKPKAHLEDLVESDETPESRPIRAESDSGVVASLPRMTEPTIGIVGTRKITQYGREVTAMLTWELVAHGFIIVSGLALGVDTVAHTTTIAEKGKTIAVLGCGVDCCSPQENQNLYDQIIKANGAIVSELPLGHAPTKGSFPARNRIIAGLSEGIVVTEGAADSGALITADYAFKNNRKVFAVPGPITSSLSKGPHDLLEKGAILVTNVQAILHEFQISNLKSQINTNKQKEKIGTEEEQEILGLLENEPLHFDEIVRKVKKPSQEVGTLLSLMEIKGMIYEVGGKFSVSRG